MIQARRLAALVALAASCRLLAGCGAPIGAAGTAETTVSHASAKRTEPSQLPLVPSRSVIDFGIVPQGGQQRLFVELHNASDKMVELERVDTSCDCVELAVAEQRITAGQSMLACVLVNLARAPEFTGQLSVDVNGFEKEGASVFHLRIDVDVRSGAYFHTLPQTPVPASFVATESGAAASSEAPAPVPMALRRTEETRP